MEPIGENELIACLERLHFSRLEAQIYIALLEGGELSGYQLAKKIRLSRPSIYNALDHLYEKGVVALVADSSSNYVAEQPEILFERLAGEFTRDAGAARHMLAQFPRFQPEEKFVNFKGFETAVLKARDLLTHARASVYLNTDFEPDCFAEEFRRLKDRGVRVILFSFLDLKAPDAEVFSHRRKPAPGHRPARLMLVADGRDVLVADRNRERGTWAGTTSNNRLMADIITEHIHNDIYLLRLRAKYGDRLFDDDVFIHTNFETRRFAK